jgi:hypothetical protein
MVQIDLDDLLILNGTDDPHVPSAFRANERIDRNAAKRGASNLISTAKWQTPNYLFHGVSPFLLVSSTGRYPFFHL